ncbi:twin-arginine translocation pathway signal protein [Mycobacterium sp. ACS1612]|uniref:cobalamin B12-binding domain-containing protein n=1 Tax=Mycobacterium sp. ACS1612 TaxID=1834117 RepID=UPI0007FD9AC5|nr:cobalamin-dependent protein [Mycobacterium sp. ACS1612]OBF30515.1 twin-arginine translocation pathway signal protein [Mycobacterium sp. ACS1612]
MLEVAQSSALQRYDQALADGDRSKIFALVDDLLGSGTEPLHILVDVVAAAQRSIGARWQRGEWTVAQEHAATAMGIAATEVVARRIAETPVTRGQILVTCAEKEWHWLPAAIIDCALRADGWQTISLGPATSPLRFSQYIQDIGPDAVAVSCSVLGALPTTRRFIEAATSAGVPAVVGGAAFGDDDVRAQALGATAWARDAKSAVEAAAALPVVVPPVEPLPAAAVQELAAMENDHLRLVDQVRRSWSVTTGADTDSVRAVARDAVPHMLHAVTAALLTDDPRTLSETAAWLAELLTSRGVDARSAVEDLNRVLAAALIDYPLSVELVRSHFSVD